MKHRLLIFLLIGMTFSCSQTTDKTKKNNDAQAKTGANKEGTDEQGSSKSVDTLTIVNSTLITDPWSFGENPLKIFNGMNGVEITFKTCKNQHVENQIDTLFQLKIGEDQFKVYKTATKNFLIGAKVMTDQFKTKHGIYIGMTKGEVLEKVGHHSKEEVPDRIRLQNLESVEWIDLQFEGDVLGVIGFEGYLD